MALPAPFEQAFAHDIYQAKYAQPGEAWVDTAHRVTSAPMGSLFYTDGARASASLRAELADATERIYGAVARRIFVPGGRYLYASGRDLHQVNNCLLMRCGDSREEWATLSYQAEMGLMTGAGIGAWYGDVRPAGSPIERTGGIASGPVAKLLMTNEKGRYTMQGGSRRSAIWAGLPWWHADVFTFIRCKDWPTWLRQKKEEDPTVAAPGDMTNISVGLDDNFFSAMNHEPVEGLGYLAPDNGTWEDWAQRVYWTVIDKMLTTAEPGFTVNTGDRADEVLRNACTEITSADDSDVCNLGSLVLSRFASPEQFGAAARDAVLFLTAGSLYSDVPYGKVADIREKNRRLGLGLMGVHEFCLQHGVRYGTPEAEQALEPYAREYGRALEYANEWQHKLRVSLSKGATAIAPNGTIGIVAETTTSAEPIFAAAYLRGVRNASAHKDEVVSQYVIDPTALRLIKQGVDPKLIEDSYSLAYEPERRFAMQAFLQRYTDHSISMTVNLPAVIRDPVAQRDFGNTLLKFLPSLKGITCYPDGARGGQPLKAVPIEEALEMTGVAVEDAEERCLSGVCGV